MAADTDVINLGDLRQTIFNNSVNNMRNAIDKNAAGESLILYYADKDDIDSIRFASNTNDTRVLYFMLMRAAQHIMDHGYGDPND